jgi:Tol biopolymer transport system component
MDAFDSERHGNTGIYVMNGTDGKRNWRRTESDGMPAWSPAAGSPDWRLGDHAHADVYVMNTDGTTQRRLARSGE